MAYGSDTSCFMQYSRTTQPTTIGGAFSCLIQNTITFQVVRKANHSLVAEFATRARAVEFVEANGLNKDELLLIQTSLDSWE